MQHVLRAVEVAGVGERIAEVRREADARRAGFSALSRELLRGSSRTARPPAPGRRATRRRGPASTNRSGRTAGEIVAVLERCLQEHDGLTGLPRRAAERPERDAGTGGGRLVACLDASCEHRLEVRLGRDRVAVQPERQLGVGEPQLADVGVAQRRAGLEVLGRNAELARQLAKRLDGRTARTGLDARDVRVRDTRRRELALGEAPLEPQPTQALPDRLARYLILTPSLHHPERESAAPSTGVRPPCMIT